MVNHFSHCLNVTLVDALKVQTQYLGKLKVDWIDFFEERSRKEGYRLTQPLLVTIIALRNWVSEKKTEMRIYYCYIARKIKVLTRALHLKRFLRRDHV